ncbi:hypothetical protein GQR58_026434 [Nymphon striatum]|nr:hypothetical protein GQR58_026434 [Nymphon striatum]
MEIITTIRGKQKQKICLEGFICTKQITSKTQIRWQCVKRCSNQCKDVISTTLDLVRNTIKYHINENIKQNMPESVKDGTAKVTPTEWMLNQMLKNVNLASFFPGLVYIAEVAITLPVSNAWPERGASALKIAETKQRNRLGSHMLEAILHVTSKNRRRLPSKKSGGRCKNLVDNLPTPASSETEVQDAGVQTDMLLHVDQEVDEIRQTLVEVKNLGDYNYYQRKEAENLSGSQVPNTKPHNHDANLMEVAKAKVELKHLATNTRERPATLLSAKLAELPAADRQLFHEDDATNKMIRRVRKGQFPPV